MDRFRTVDCETWARTFLEQHRELGRGMLLEIRPKAPAIVLGGVRMPSGMEWPSPPWHYHFAAIIGSTVYDEAYPSGLPEHEYKARFQYAAFLDFTIRRP